jgi:hypothetical protein
MESIRKRQIERMRRLSRENFQRDYLAGVGTPVIVTDAMDRWSALTKWDFDFFRSQYGSDTVVAVGGMQSKAAKVMKLADYIDYAERPTEAPRGFWIDPATRLPLSQPAEPPTAPLYVYTWNPMAEHPELLADVEASPYFVEDWVALLPEEMRRLFHWANQPYFWVFIGPKGTQSPLHQDFGCTHTYLAQIRGSKRCMLFSPDDSAFIYHGRINPEQPDLVRFPLLEKATCFEAVLEPGEMLFMPARWWHHVVAVEKSITFSYSFFNRANFGDYFLSFIRNLPDSLAAFDRFPGLRAALGVAWVCKGFDYPDGPRTSTTTGP